MKPSEKRKRDRASNSKGGNAGARSRRSTAMAIDSYLPRGEYGKDRIRPWEV